MDYGFVETSDVEELAELGKHGKDVHPYLGPQGQKHSPRRELPRKRIKLFHGGEQAVPSSPVSHSSPLRDSQYVNRPNSYREENSKSPGKESHKPEPSLWTKPLTTPVSSQTQPSSTPSIVGSPSTSQLYSSQSSTRTPPITESLPKLENDELPVPSPFCETQNTLFTDPPLKAGIEQSQRSPPNLGTRIQSGFNIELTPGNNTQNQPSTTPPDTPHSAYQSSHFHRSLSPDPLALLGNSVASRDDTSSPVSQLFFSPRRISGAPPTASPPLSNAHPLSVRTAENSRVADELPSLADERPSPLSAASHSGSPSSSPLTRLGRTAPLVSVAAPADDRVALAALAEDQQGLRYSFRRRNAAQLAPYTADLIRYKRALRFNPDAIVKMKQIERQVEQGQQHRHPDDHYEDDQFADQLDASEDADWEERERRRRRRLEKMKEIPSAQDLSHYPTILQDLLSTDEEEKEMDAASKAARKILRAKEREQKAKEKEEAKRRRKTEEEERSRARDEKAKRPKPYPLSKSKNENSGRRSPCSTKHYVADPQAERSSSRHTSPPFPSFHSLQGRNVNNTQEPYRAEEEDDVVRNDSNDVDFDMYDDLPQVAFDEPGTLSYPSSPPRSMDVVFEDALEQDIEDAPQPPGSRSSDIPDLEGLNLNSKKEKRILLRMMPRGMAEEYSRQAANDSHRGDGRSHSPVSDPENDGPLLPGQTRVRKAANPKDIQDVRGDSESEEDSRSNPASSSSSPSIISDASDSDSDSVEILHSYRAPPPRQKSASPERIHVVSDSEGDEDIQFFVQNTRPFRKQKKFRDQSLINYMLPRVHTTGGSRRKISYKYDIMTRGSRGHGRERQVLLSFDEHKLKKRRRHDSGAEAIGPSGGTNHSRSSFARTASRSNKDALFEGNPLASNSTSAEVHYVHDQDKKHLGRKENEKLRKARARNNGVYNFNSEGNARITTGRRTDAAFFTVDLEDEGFHHALAPTTGSGSGSGSGPRYEPPRKRKQLTARTSTNTLFEEQRHDENPSVQDDGQATEVSGGKMKIFTCDLGIKRISSGRSFSQSSYIRKGWLHELVNVASSGMPDNANAAPLSTMLCRFELNSTMGVGTLCATLPKVFDALFEGATDILDADSDTLSDEWKPGFRIASQLISWYIQTAQEGEKTVLREVVDKEVTRITNLMDKHSINFVETPILSLCWFLVELSARVSAPLPSSYLGLSSSLKMSSKILMQLLLRIGIEKTADTIKSDINFHEANLVHYATQLWVCLIHLLGMPKEGTPKSKSNPFWSVLMDALPSVDSKDSTYSVKVNEDVWLRTFTLSALSQFSVHGMATAEPRLPAYWDLVAYGLKSICLTETEEQQGLQLPFLRKRDRYVALVVTRCEHLHKIWHWRLDEGSSMFNQISEIFRSRNFANLRFEDDKLPKFFKHTDWSLLESHDSTDTILSIFLKLIMSADRDEVNVTRKSAKRKKLLSLAVPLRSLSFPINRPPNGRELSMFYNRLSAIALALYLDPSDHDERINKARHYVDFTTSDTKTRHTILCGLERLCHLMIKRDMNLGSMLDWIDDLSKVLDAEMKVFSSEHPSPCRANNLVDPPIQLVKHLLDTAGRIVASYADGSRFFEPLLFGKLKSILASSVLKTDTLREEFAQLLDVIFIARTRVLPKPPRPFTPEEETNEESQNYFEGFDDIDFAAIDNLPGNDHAVDILEKDRIFRQDVDGKLKWVIYAHLKPYVASPPPPTMSWKAYANECDKWLRRWLCFNDLQQIQDNKWHNPIHLLDVLTINAQDKDNDDPWIHRVNLSIMFQLLQLDPMAYLSFMNRALQVFFRALVSDSLTLENEYVSFLLSIDCLRHPLFTGAATVLSPRDATSADYQFSADKFLELRLPLIRVIFHNIERSLSDEDTTEMEARAFFIDLCHSMFSWMRRVRTQLLQKTGDNATQYTRFCLEVLHAFQENPLLRTQHRLEFFLGWARTLAASP